MSHRCQHNPTFGEVKKTSENGSHPFLIPLKFATCNCCRRLKNWTTDVSNLTMSDDFLMEVMEFVKAGQSRRQFPVKLTEPLTAILYITKDKQHIIELYKALHVKEVGENKQTMLGKLSKSSPTIRQQEKPYRTSASSEGLHLEGKRSDFEMQAVAVRIDEYALSKPNS
uniref:Uncharacterized protein n=1 Tax=Glossina pallidipes TaxID=7398 RepID=A0A1A9ZFU0_GLOPL